MRGRLLLGLALLATVPLGLLAAVSASMLHRVAQGLGADAVALRHADSTGWLLWLAAGVLAATTLALALVWIRREVLGPLERLARRLELSAGVDPLTALESRLRTLQAEATRATLERDSQLDAVRAALERVGAQLVEAQRLGITGRLALGAAHEIGGPLSIAVAAVDAMAAGDTSPTLAQTLEDALLRIDAILRELTRFGRPEAQEPAAGVELGALAAEVVALARLHPRVRPLPVTLRGDGEAAILVLAPRRHLEQVVLNLLVNAADAAGPRGAIEVSAAVERDEAGAAWGVIAVDDTGPGVPDHLRERIFEPFFTTKPAQQGTGLGLAISRRLMRDAGGTLTVGRNAKHGARFRMALPLVPGQPPPGG